MKVAIVHDDITQRGGAERVVLSLLRLFPDADLYTSIYDPEGAHPEFREVDVRTTFMQRLPHRGDAARRLLPIYPLAFNRMVLRGYGLVISSSSRFAHGVRAPGAFHVCYCHAPARFLYMADRYLVDGGPAPQWMRPVLRPVLAAIRRWDHKAAQRPDAYIANARNVAGRIRALYGREATVVHPPVELADIVPATRPPKDFYLTVGRLLPYKAVDLAVRVCTERAAGLVVVGDGPDRRRLEALAGDGVRFAGSVPRSKLVELLRDCRAVIQPGEEDFGLVPLEANAAGRPAVAAAAGGALETVVDGRTGVLFQPGDSRALHAALERVDETVWDTCRLREHAEAFGEPRFHAAFMDQLAALNAMAARSKVAVSVTSKEVAR